MFRNAVYMQIMEDNNTTLEHYKKERTKRLVLRTAELQLSGLMVFGAQASYAKISVVEIIF